MAARSSDQNEAMPLRPPEWMLNAARHAVDVSGVNPQEAFAARLREAKAMAESGSQQHQGNMLVLAAKMKDVRKMHGLRLSSTAAQAKVAPVSSSERDPASTATQKDGIQATEITKQKGTTVESGIRAKKKNEKKVRMQMEAKQIAKKTKPTPINTAPQFRTTNTTTSPNDINRTDTDTLPLSKFLTSQHETERYPVHPKLPEWYTSISLDSLAMKALNRKRPAALTALDSLKAFIIHCEQALISKPSSHLPALWDKLRDAVHKAEITLVVTPHILRKANMLSPAVGLPRIFHKDAEFPPDLKADAYQLYLRWHKGDLTQDLLRGIVTRKAHNRTSDSICGEYRSKFPVNARYHGHGALVAGQWWPTQLCAVRDGAHGSSQGGIFGDKIEGAYSVVLSAGAAYDDIDAGDVVQYSGTKSASSTPTDNTRALLASRALGNPIRVIRSAQLGPQNRFRPHRGLRYDGLYVVTRYEVLDAETASYRFRLERCAGQDAIRCEGKATRPTVWEVQEYERLREKGAW